MLNPDLLTALQEKFSADIAKVEQDFNETTVTIHAAKLRPLCYFLRDDPAMAFDTLIDVTVVDYLHFGVGEWETDSATSTGFGRARGAQLKSQSSAQRFAAVYHLLSVTKNQRLRIKAYLSEKQLKIDSVVDIWPSANWYEREAYDLFGVFFEGHPDLRRILTDYGFIGHPFRKDFPLSGNVEVRYDPAEGRVIYQPVSIEPRVLVPKVVRESSNG